MYECIPVDEPELSAGVLAYCTKDLLLNSPINQANNTPEAAKRNGSGYIPSLSLLLLSYAACLAHHINESHNQGSEADAAKGVCESPSGCTPCSTTWHSAWLSSTEEPTAINTCDNGVNRILKPKRFVNSATFSAIEKEPWRVNLGHELHAASINVLGRIEMIAIHTTR